MARPKSDDKRDAIIAAAIRVIAAQGPGAPTAVIAKEAGVANGSLFNYFETKAHLFNQVYRELKAEMGAAAPGDRIAKDSDTRRLMFQMWSQWMRSATACPDKRRTLAHLGVSDDITPESRAFAHAAMAGVRGLLQRSRKNGSMRHAPLEFVAALMGSLADTTIDFMIRDPGNADKHGKAGFDALWRMIA